MRSALCAVLVSYSSLVFGIDIPDCSKTFLGELIPQMKEVLQELKPKDVKYTPSSERRMRDVAGYHYQPFCLQLGKLQSLLRLVKNGVVPVKLSPVQEDAFEQMEKAAAMERCEGKADKDPEAGSYTEGQVRRSKLQKLFFDFAGVAEEAPAGEEKNFCKAQLQWEALDLADRSLAMAQESVKKIPNYDGQMGYDQGAIFCGHVGKVHAATTLALAVTADLNSNPGDDSYGPEDNAAQRLKESLESIKPYSEDRCKKNIKVGDGDKAFDAVATAGRRVEKAAENLAYERRERFDALERSRGKEGGGIMESYGFPHRLSREAGKTPSRSHQ